MRYRRLVAAGLLAFGLLSCRFQACTGTRGCSPALKSKSDRHVDRAKIGHSGATPQAADAARSPLATNLDGLYDWSVEWSFVDAFKRSRKWISGSDTVWEDQRPIQVDEHGWVRSLAPGQIARTLMFWADGLPYPSGDYVILYDGHGTLRYFNNDNVVVSAPGRDVLRVDSKKGGISILITATDPADYIRNIRVIMPGGSCENDAVRYCETDAQCDKAVCVPFEKSYAKQIFHPTFLKSLRSYSAIRFMTWMFANEAKQREWTSRPKPDDARWTLQGAPVEILVDLANRLHVDPWFTLPHEVSDDYVRKFAGVVRDRLDAGLRAFVEYSNEPWNSVFPQSVYFADRGQQAGLSGDRFEAQLKFYSRRTVQIFRIWEQVFGGKDKLVRVMGSQAANPWVSETELDFEDALEHTDALAIAPYFGGYLGDPANHDRVANMSLDSLMSELRGPALDEAGKWMADQAKVAESRNVALVAYEGGQHLAGVGPVTDDPRINALFDRANRDVRMRAIYAAYLKKWRESGGLVFAHFVNVSAPSKWGRWGALESLEQPPNTSPKFMALQDFIAQNPRWW